jgi:long-chain acyl-CoA synthetase
MSYRNLTELHRRQALLLGPKPALRTKRGGRYQDLNWRQYRADVMACAAALVDAGVEPGDRVGLLAENRIEWLIADLAILAAAAVNVPPHAPLTARQIHFQLADAGVRWLFVSTQAQLEKIEQVAAELPALAGVVVFQSSSPGPSVAPSRGRPVTLTWADFLKQGWRVLARFAEELQRREETLTADSLATIMYTSGTTGNPKGVMLTHGNLLSNAQAMLEGCPFGKDALFLNWLPFSHIYARTVDHYLSLVAGTVLALAESPETVLDNLQEIQPTHMSSVPRFYEKVLLSVASEDGEERSRKLREIFGPRIDWLNSGGARLPRPVAEAYHAAGLLLMQGYGLTESSPVISFNRKGRNKIDTVGEPLPGVEAAIAPDGEVLTRGPHVMKGYWNNPQATADALRDGWLHTGDLGQLDADGYLKITGRKKELLVLSNGKKVVPSTVEGLLVSDPCIDQAVVCGEGRNYLTALLVPHWENLRRALRAEGLTLDHEAEEALAAHAAVSSFLQRRVETALADLANWERVKKFVVLPRPFSVDAEELTVSLKLRRNVVVAKHASHLERLYRE